MLYLYTKGLLYKQIQQKVTKLVAVLATFTLMTNKKTKKRTRVNLLYFISQNLQRSDKDLTRLEKQSQYNEPSFCLLVRPQDFKDYC